jgi:hypothetical protein
MERERKRHPPSELCYRRYISNLVLVGVSLPILLPTLARLIEGGRRQTATDKCTGSRYTGMAA